MSTTTPAPPAEGAREKSLLPHPLPAGQVKALLRDLLADPWEPDQPAIMLWGGPGCGKSAINAQIAEECGWGFIDIRLTQVQVIDILGLPYIDRITNGDGQAVEAMTRFAKSVFLPTRERERWIIILDELPSATPTIQTQAYQLMGEHRIGPHRLGPGVHIVAAGNRLTDRGIVYKMPSPLVNRCLHLEVTAELEDWLTYMYPRGLLPEVAAYLRRYPQRLFEMHADVDTLPFPTPRSWTYSNWTLRKQLGRCERDEALRRSRVLLEGLIGPGAASDFFTFLRVFGELPDVEAIMEGRSAPQPPKDPDALFALVSSLVGQTRQYENLAPFLEYTRLLPRSFAVLALRDSFRQGEAVRRRIQRAPVWAQTAAEYKDAIFALASAENGAA